MDLWSGWALVPFIGIKVIDLLLTVCGLGEVYHAWITSGIIDIYLSVIITGGVYPLLTTALGQWWFPCRPTVR